MKNELTVSSGLIIPLIVSLSLFSITCSQLGSGPPSSAKQIDTLRPTNQWFTLAPNIDEFSVEMPGLTTSITQATPNTYLYKDNGRAYVLIAFPTSDENEKLSDEELLASYGRTFSRSMLEGFSISEPPRAKHLTLNGASGVEYRLSDGQRIRILRLYVRKKRLTHLTE